MTIEVDHCSRTGALAIKSAIQRLWGSRWTVWIESMEVDETNTNGRLMYTVRSDISVTLFPPKPWKYIPFPVKSHPCGGCGEPVYTLKMYCSYACRNRAYRRRLKEAV